MEYGYLNIIWMLMTLWIQAMKKKMQAFCKYIKDVIVPNGYESIEYLVNRLNLKTIGLSRYQLYASTEEANFCVRFVKNMYAKDMIYIHMFCKDWALFRTFF